MFMNNHFALVYLFILQTATVIIGIPGNSKIQTWSLEEDEKLLKMLSQHNDTSNVWKTIAHTFNRTPNAVQKHHRYKLDPNLKDTRSEWTEEENRIILKEAENAKLMNRSANWQNIAHQMKRSSDAVYNQFKRIRKKAEYSTFDALYLESAPKKQRQRKKNEHRYWTAEEDAKLLEIYKKHNGLSNVWLEISKHLNRSPRSIQRHYFDVLRPNLKRARSEWTQDEIRLILEEVENSRINNRKASWKEVARQMNRSSNAVFHQMQKIMKQGMHSNLKLREERNIEKADDKNDVNVMADKHITIPANETNDAPTIRDSRSSLNQIEVPEINLEELLVDDLKNLIENLGDVLDYDMNTPIADREPEGVFPDFTDYTANNIEDIFEPFNFGN